MTVEAAFSLSFFIFMMISLILPMKLIHTHRQVQTALEAIGEQASQYAYIKAEIDRGKEGKTDSNTFWGQEFLSNFKTGAMEILAAHQAVKHADTSAIEQVSGIRSRIMEDGENIDLIVDYRVRLPFPILRISSVPQSARSYRRAWIGSPGGLGGTQGTGGGETESVYIGKGSTRYHKNRNCHYLSNKLTTVSYEDVKNIRNQNGGKYKACGVCKAAGQGGIVYIMPSGSSFHSNVNCSAIIAYVQQVPLSEVKHLGACSYCSK